MFSVLFDIHAQPDQRQAHAALQASMVRELAQVPGFVESILYKSLVRDGWLLSLSTWRDEKSVVRWRTNKRHHEAQVFGRAELLEDYRFRVCEVTHDTRVPAGFELREQRLDVSEIGAGTAITLIDASQTLEWIATKNAEEIALYLGFDPYSYGDCVSWDVCQAEFSPEELILLCSWKDQASAIEYAKSAMTPDDSRVRAARVVRDYSMFDRREAPQYFPDAAGRVSVHA